MTMDENQEQKLAALLSDIVDGRAGMDSAAGEPELLDAAVAANVLRQGFGDEPALAASFDAQLRARLVAQTAARAKIVPMHRRPWLRGALAAALIMLIVGPFWLFSRHAGVDPFGDDESMQLQRLEYYDNKYESRLNQLRERIDRSAEPDIMVRTSLSRSDERFENIRQKRQNERRMQRVREYTTGGNEL